MNFVRNIRDQVAAAWGSLGEVQKCVVLAVVTYVVARAVLGLFGL